MKKTEKVLLSIPKDLSIELQKEDPWYDRGGKQAVILYYLRLGLKAQKKMNQILNEWNSQN